MYLAIIQLIRYLKKNVASLSDSSLLKLERLELCNESSFTRVNTLILALILAGYIQILRYEYEKTMQNEHLLSSYNDIYS